MQTIIAIMDAAFMPLYRLSSLPILGFYIGTFSLAALCVVLGWAAAHAALVFNRSHVLTLARDMASMNNLSIEALQAGDGPAYRACNSLANDACGKVFFMQAAISAAALWPVPFALAWLQAHFEGIPFFVAGSQISLGYAGMFILIYILARIALGPALRGLRVFSRSAQVLDELSAQTRSMRSWSDLSVIPKS